MFSCQDAHRTCILDTREDSSYMDQQSQWASFCGSAFPESEYTTSNLASFVVPTSSGCEYISIMCSELTSIANTCWNSPPYNSYKTDCFCGSKMLTLESACKIDAVSICPEYGIKD